MKKILLFVCVVFSTHSAISQLTTDWQRNTGLIPYGDMMVKTDNEQNPVVVRGLASGGGFTQVGTCITKYDTEGNQLWSVVDEEFFDDFGFGMNDFDFDSDNNIIMGGIEMSPEDFYTHSMLIKLAPDGSELWRTNLSPVMTWSERIENLVVAEDGSVFATAVLYLEDVETLAQALVKINAAGQVEWTNFENNEGFYGIAMDDEGMLYTTGYNSVRKYNQDGEMLWSVPFGFSDDAFYSTGNASGIIQVEGTHIRVTAYGYYPETNQNRIGLVAGNTDGNNFNFFEFDILPGQDNESINLRNFCVSEDGNTFIAGNVSYGESGPAMVMNDVERGSKGGTSVNGLLVYQISPSGENEWTYTEFPEEGEETIFSIGAALRNNELIVVCNGGYVPTSSELVFNFNRQSGAINWTQTISNTSEFSALFPQSLNLSDDGSLYLTGNGNLLDNSQNAYLNKYEFEEETVDVATLNNNESVMIYPNPAGNAMHVLNTETYRELRITDASGRLVSTQNTTGKNRVLLNTEHLESGMYQLLLIGNSNTITRTFIKN